MTDVAESLLTVQCALLPGTDAQSSAARLADAVDSLPVAAAAGVGQYEVPPHAAAQATSLAEKQGMPAGAAADFVMFLARLWYAPDQRFNPRGWYEVAAALRTVWERDLGVHSGMLDVTVFPVGMLITSDAWLAMARTCEWFAVTSDAPDGLIPV